MFGSWIGSTLWLVIGAYLIANAVQSSGLGERIAYSYMLKFVSNYNSIIIGTFALTFVLSILIPHPWPRAFLIMSVMAVVIKSSEIPKEDAVKIGFSVFAASVPVSLIFITGDAVINPLAIDSARLASNQEFGSVDFIEWFRLMGPPAIIASLIAMVMVMFMYRPTKEVVINKEEIQAKFESLGSMGTTEKRTAIWIGLAIVLWLTESVHGINIGWVTLAVAMAMGFPVIGEVLTPADWKAVPMQVLVFLVGAIAIGVVGGTGVGATGEGDLIGMNEWIANTLLPAEAPTNLFILALFIALIAIVVHMVLGSVIAVMGVVVPAMVGFTDPAGLTPLFAALIAYFAIASHYVLPFQHLNTLVGATEETGGYTQKETIKFGIAWIPIIFIITIVMVAYWKMIGLVSCVSGRGIFYAPLYRNRCVSRCCHDSSPLTCTGTVPKMAGDKSKESPMSRDRVVVGISGATGFQYGVKALELLKEAGVETHLVMSKAAELTRKKETDYLHQEVVDLADVHYPLGAVGAAISSGSFKTLGMIVAPCSMQSLASIAAGTTSNLLTRAADVVLKERRPLVLMVRETPFHLGHIRNMETVTEYGAICFPPVPAFYAQPKSLDEIVTHSVARALGFLGVDSTHLPRWGESLATADEDINFINYNE